MHQARRICLASKPEELDRLARFSEELAQAFLVDEDKKHQLMLVLSEAVTNAMVHGNGLDPQKEVCVTIHPENNALRIVIRDQGEGFNPDAVPDPLQEQNLLKTGGRGIWLIRRFTEHVQYKDGGSTLEAVFALS